MTKVIIMMLILFAIKANSQMLIKDEAMRYQQERMVFKQWDKNKFKPGGGFLGLSPYYWLTWGLMPSYKKKDLRPLSATGPQTQRLAMVGVMNTTDENYKNEGEQVRTASLSAIANTTGTLADLDPLWLLYYKRELKPVTDFNGQALLNSLPPSTRQKVVDEGLFKWYTDEMAILNERLNSARTVDMDRGARIMAYYRMLADYRKLLASWESRTATAVKNTQLQEQQEKVKTNQVKTEGWTPQTDVDIARDVLQNRKY